MLSPGFVPVVGERIQAGDRVVLARPDGSKLSATIQGTSTSTSASTEHVRILLDLANKDVVPIGTEVWSIGA